MVEQLGVAMMPVLAARWSALTSGTTSGTVGSMRNMLDLSITVAPAATAWGAYFSLTEPPAAKNARSTPSNEPGPSSLTSSSAPWNCSRRPADRALARRRSSATGNARSSRIARTVPPTTPVAPAMATVYRPAAIRRCSGRPSGGAPVCRLADHGVVVELEHLVQLAHGLVDVLLGDDARDLDRRRADHVEVDAQVSERLEHLRGDARVRAHAGADEADLGDRRLDVVLARPELAGDVPERLVGGRDVLRGDRAGDVAVAALAGVLNDRVDVDVRGGEGAEHERRHSRAVGHAADHDLGFVGRVGDGPDDRLFELLVGVHRVASVCDPRAFGVGEARPHVDGDAVLARVLDGAQGEHLRSRRGHLEHLVVGDAVDLAGLGHEARIGGVDAVDVGVDLAHVGAERVCQRHGRGVRAAAAERGDVAVRAHALEAGDEHDLALAHGLADARRVDVED